MRRIVLALILVPAFLMGCGGSGATTFVHPEFNFGYVERIAVIPFENLSEDQGAGARATRYFAAELLSTDAFDVVESGEVTRALTEISLFRTADLTRDQAVVVGKSLDVQALVLGSVGESSARRGGSRTTSTVSLIVRLVETDTGSTVWSTTVSADSRGFWSGLFGTAERSKSEVMTLCVKRAVDELVE